MEAIATLVVKHSIADWEQGTARRELLMPLGLLLLSRGWITRDELNAALAAQRQHGQGRIGEWLCRLGVLSEATVAKGLAAQWNCTALIALTGGIERADDLAPAALLDQYGLVLMRNTMNARLYLAGGSRAEYATARALERMLEVPVEPAFLEDAAWLRYSRSGTREPLDTPHSMGAAVAISQVIERHAPRDARVVRIHNHLWLRMYDGRRKRSPGHLEDVVVALRSHGEMVRAG